MDRTSRMAAHPDFPWLSPDDAPAASRVLTAMGLLSDGERVDRVAKAGEGNMNLTLRVWVADPAGGGRTLILKQSRPWVEKYDQIEAPWERAVTEARFYRRAAEIPHVAALMPRLLGDDAAAKALAFEDLGEASDLTGLYGDASLHPITVAALARYLRSLHDATRGRPDPDLANRAMRELNHQHVYDLPLRADGPMAGALDGIEPGLAEAAAELRADADYVALVRATGERYLSDGPCLLHGDYFPGSWLTVGPATPVAPGALRVIDPEFCYYGDAEFDLGVAAAHLALADQPYAAARSLLDAYGPVADARLLGRYAGIEVMRRLIGVAQLPLPRRGRRAALLRRSRSAVLSGELEQLWDA